MSSDRRNSDYISPWGYIGHFFLWCIPVVGWIIWIVNCFSRKENLRNYARSVFCGYLLALIMLGLLVVLVAMGIITPETFPTTMPQPMV